MKRILVLDGGGTKGVIQSAICKMIEKETGKRIHETFDLIVGESVGAILGGVYAVGIIPAERVHEILLETLPRVFRRVPFRLPKYRRKPLNRVWEDVGFSTLHLHNCQTKFMCSAVNMVDSRNHFFKSWEDKDGGLLWRTAITRSYSAPVFFGTMVDKKERSVWLDGGTGNSNCPLDYAIVEAVRQDWIGKEDLYILSLGTGHKDHSIPFKKARRYKALRQAFYFMDPLDGGLARVQSAHTKVEQARELALSVSRNNHLRDFFFQRIDTVLPDKMDAMDQVKYIKEYEKYGYKLSGRIDFNFLHF